MKIKDYIKSRCIEVDMENMFDNGFKTEDEIKEWYEKQTDAILLKVFDEYYGYDVLLDMEIKH